jgi:hypothetical protein
VSREKLKSLPQYAAVRNQQKEWSGITKFSSGLRLALGGLHRLADYNLIPAMNSIANSIQKSDEISLKGERRVSLSCLKYAFEGFNFNRKFPFNSVLRVSVTFETDRNTLTAKAFFPRINTDIDLLNVQRLPYFRLLLSIGTISDMFFDDKMKDYLPVNEAMHGASKVVESQWYPAKNVIENSSLFVQMPESQQALLTDEVSVILSIGVEFGDVGFTGMPQQVKYAGCGKIIAVR